jgi:hypothetical protein
MPFYLIVDGTLQSIGAMPFFSIPKNSARCLSVQVKMLMGGYGLGVAYLVKGSIKGPARKTTTEES